MQEFTEDQEKLYKQLLLNEGKRNKKYVDTVGKVSIGIGRNLTDIGIRPHEVEYLWKNEIAKNPVLEKYNNDFKAKASYVNQRVYSTGLSEDEIKYFWKSDILEVETQLDNRLPWWRSLDINRQRVMIDLCFNMGISTLLTFKNTLAAIKAGKYKTAARNMLLSKWATQVDRKRGDNKGRADLLAKMMETGYDTFSR